MRRGYRNKWTKTLGSLLFLTTSLPGLTSSIFTSRQSTSPAEKLYTTDPTPAVSGTLQWVTASATTNFGRHRQDGFPEKYGARLAHRIIPRYMEYPDSWVMSPGSLSCPGDEKEPVRGIVAEKILGTSGRWRRRYVRESVSHLRLAKREMPYFFRNPQKLILIICPRQDQ